MHRGVSGNIYDQNSGHYRWTFHSDYTASSYGVPAARHNLMVNILYVDGHAGKVKVGSFIEPCNYAPFRNVTEDKNLNSWTSY